MTQSQLSLLKGVSFVSRLSSLHVNIWWFQHHLLKDCPCSTVSDVLAMFVCVCFWELCFGPLISLSAPLSGPHCLNYCHFMESL